jgi:beta-lactamase class A
MTKFFGMERLFRRIMMAMGSALPRKKLCSRRWIAADHMKGSPLFLVFTVLMWVTSACAGLGDADIKKIEAQAGGGRLGVAALDTATGRRIEYHAQERFPMCSTFKLLAVAAVLHRVDRQQDRLDRFVPYTQRDILEYAPITKQHLSEGGMTLEALCAAAIVYSDNTAANLLVQTIDGPAGLTDYARSLGDKMTRLDRVEPDLNSAKPGDVRDTTTPGAMLADMNALLLSDDALSSESRRRLETWLSQNTTGAALVRAGVPPDWSVGDKTGRGANGSTNDIAILRPPNRGAPILLCVYLTESKRSDEEREKVIAEVARAIAR